MRRRPRHPTAWGVSVYVMVRSPGRVTSDGTLMRNSVPAVMDNDHEATIEQLAQ
jgi:hypothetical protein